MKSSAQRLLLLASIVSAATAAFAQTGSDAPVPPPPDKKAETPRGDAPGPADRDFNPTEEISPDQEVDFPADL